jgi:DNA-binding CsgD family transcriptional regulator
LGLRAQVDTDKLQNGIARRKERNVLKVRAVTEDRVFAEVKRLCCSTFDEATLLRRLAESLRRAVPFDAYCVHTNDPSSGLMTRAFAEKLGSEIDAAHYFERLYLEDEIENLHWNNQSRHPVYLISDATGGRLERSQKHRELTGRLGLGYEALVAGVTKQEIWGGMDLNREEGRADFDLREVRFLRRVAPHLGAGLKSAALRSLAFSEPESDGIPGVLVLDVRGRVSHHTAAAERWLRDIEGDIGPGWEEGGGLPVAVRTVTSALRRALSTETERDRDVVPRLCVRGRSGRWLNLQASRSETGSSRGEETVVVIEPAGPREMAWLRAAAYGLSAREREVVNLVVRGASTREISRTLYISEPTVQEHLSNVFDKVGVRSRGELVKRLFLDNLYPSLLRP